MGFRSRPVSPILNVAAYSVHGTVSFSQLRLKEIDQRLKELRPSQP
jgi:hypothetical protein